MAVDYKKAARWIEREIQELSRYLEGENATGWPERKRQAIAGYVAGTAHIGHGTMGLSYFASYTSAIGCLKVLRGEEQGFKEIDIACLYNFWALRLLVLAYERDTRPDKQPRIQMESAATCWAHASALGVREIVDWLGDRVRRVDGGDASIGGKGMNPLCTLMASVATGKSAAELKRGGWCAIEPYQAVVDRTLTAQEYEELADYHTRRVGGSGFPAFSFFPYRIVPFELFAIEKLTGVPIENPKHPLLTSPLARRREVPEIPMNDELAAVIERARSELQF